MRPAWPARCAAKSISRGAREWLRTTRQGRWLHIFEGACNLTNERGEVLSLVGARIGDGPFNVVIAEDGLCFPDVVDIHASIGIHDDRLLLGGLVIDMRNAALAPTRPDWQALHSHKYRLIAQLDASPMAHGDASVPSRLRGELCAAIAAGDASRSAEASKRLAGRGVGLTPAGDDILLGAMLAARVLHPAETASLLGEAIAEAAVSLTTTLSAAWIKAAAQGEVGASWLRLFGALLAADANAVAECIRAIITTGRTSGADALSGFCGALAYASLAYDLPQHAG